MLLWNQWNESGYEHNRTCYKPITGRNDVITLVLAILLTNLDVAVVVGNLLVLLAFTVDRRLRTPTHYFIGSLAAADLALGVFVLPVAIAFETAGAWTFGIPLCQLWLAVDVWLCTASIYGLIMVGVDRYVAVTRPLAYKSFMTHRKASLMIATAWSISLLICLPTFVVSSYRASKAVESTCQCTQMIHGPVYIVYSAVGSFYLPMAIIGYVYVCIYRTIRRIKLQGISGVVNIDYSSNDDNSGAITERTAMTAFSSRITSHRSRRRKTGARLSISRSVPTRMTLRVHKGGYREDQTTPLLRRKQSDRSLPAQASSPKAAERSISSSTYLNPHFDAPVGHKRQVNTNGALLSPMSLSPATSQTSLTLEPIGSDPESSRPSGTTAFMGFLAVPNHITSMWCQRMDTFHRYHQRLTSELGALRTVGMVTGGFVICWIGFCIVYSIHAWPQCRYSPEVGGSACVPDWVVSVMVWFGYANSAINPIIYTASNENFRRAFRHLLKFDSIGRKSSSNCT